eukprot:1212603-Alexandrium_andersonii.AAC.1
MLVSPCLRVCHPVYPAVPVPASTPVEVCVCICVCMRYKRNPWQHVLAWAQRGMVRPRELTPRVVALRPTVGCIAHRASMRYAESRQRRQMLHPE